ncbi:MAG: RimK family alpha-L-glutamate ligase [Clostridia bacterium]|nr:RimK family alpha-L-glutamate ligase [Clostridia bacterium]
MAGYIVYNGFWNGDVPDPVRRLAAAGDRLGVTLSPIPNTAFAAEISRTGGSGLAAGDLVLCWDKDVRLLRALEADGVIVQNSADAVAVCDDKSLTHIALSRQGLPQPRTMLAPMTYVSYTEAGEAFLQTAAERLGFPLVFKECFGSLGEQVYLVADAAELRARAASMKHRPFVLQEFIAGSAGTDKRLYVVGDRVVAAMRRHSDGDFRANIGAGGSGEAYTPTAQEEELAKKACQALGLVFAGVDLLDGPDGPLICEVNASAHMAALEACTGVDVAGEIVQKALAFLR